MKSLIISFSKRKKTLILLLALIISILTLPGPPAGASENQDANVHSSGVKLAILSLKISKSGNQYSLSVTNYMFLNTSKNFDNTLKSWKENDFVCFLLNKENRVIDTLVIQQPLNVRYEFPEVDGSIGSTTVGMKENEIVLRFPYRKQIEFIRIDRVGKDGALQTLDTLKMPKEK
jgi:hypothetical protein